MSNYATQVRAQDDGLRHSEIVSIEAEDGLTLVGEFWAIDSSEPAPAILLMQPLSSGRLEWEPLIEPLYTAGYNILAVDVRGTGETGGEADIELTISDAELWLSWLADQPSVHSNALVTMGNRQSANVAIIACMHVSNCTTSIALSPTIAPNTSYGYHDSIDLVDALSNLGNINTFSMLVLDQRSAANFIDMARMGDILCCNVELNLHLFPSTQDYNPDGIQMVEANMDSAMSLILWWLDSQTNLENLGLPDFTMSWLEIVSNTDPRAPLDTALAAGTTTDFDLAIEECCYFIVEVETAVEWSVSPSNGASIDSHTGELTIDPDVPTGIQFSITANVENGRRQLTATLTVTDIASNPLIGEWHEIGQLTCDTNEMVDVDETIGELIFEANGDFSVTWHPFEVYVDYIGTYNFTADGHLILTGRSVNYFPHDFDANGQFSFDDDGNLRLIDVWLGLPPSSAASTHNCGHVFARR